MTTLPKHILKALRTNKTSLGEHPALPPEEEEKFLVGIVSNTFEKLCEKINTDDYESIKSNLGKILSECKKIERNNIQALETLCANIINEIFQIPQDTLKITGKIVDSVDVSRERLIPEKTTDFSFDDIDDMNHLSDEIYKRRMLNALITGAAMYYMNNITYYVKELFEIDSDLPSLYKKAIDYNNVLLFYEKDTLDVKKNLDGGKVDVIISSPDTYPEIKAEAILFPILVEESIKGILELAISHGLPKKIDKAKYVMSKSDFKLAEMWDMRIGLALWTLIEEEVSDCGFDMLEVGMNFFLMELSQLDCDDFNKTLQEIFARTRKGKEILGDILEKITYNKEMDDFDDYIKTKNDSEVQLNDDDYFTPQDIITDNIDYYI